nr:MAG TPA: hypothetical protein [Caudoviricetes sp.]
MLIWTWNKWNKKTMIKRPEKMYSINEKLQEIL